MATSVGQVVAAAQSGFRNLDAELAQRESRHVRRVFCRSASGTGDINENIELDRAYRLVYVRCHFDTGSGGADFVLRIRSRLGTEWDVEIARFTGRGTGADVWFIVPGQENIEPSPWTMQVGDVIRCAWTNPMSGTMKWGLEVGLAMAT